MEIYSIYGIAPKKPKQTHQPPVQDECVVCSTQEVCSSQETFENKGKEVLDMDTKAELKGLVEADMQDVVEEVVEHKAKPKEVVQKKDLVGAAVVEWVDSKKLTFVRSGPQGFEEVKLEAGDSGFCIARLGDKIVETEVPNLLLAPLAPVLRPDACKRPAAAMAEDKAEVEDNNLDEDDGDDKSDPSEEMQEEPPSHEMEDEPPSHGDGKPADVPPEPIVRKYGKMYHKNGHAYGIRRKFLGNNQAFQVGGTACKLSPAQLSTIADETIRKMEEEDLEEGLALLWAKEEMKRVS